MKNVRIITRKNSYLIKIVLHSETFSNHFRKKKITSKPIHFVRGSNHFKRLLRRVFEN